MELSSHRYKRTELVEGWLIVEDAIATNGQNKEDDQSLSESEDESIAAVRGNRQKADQKQPKPVTWLRRELKDCREDLSDLASKMIQEMEKRQKQCLPDLMGMLHKCLDFGNHFDAVCGVKIWQKTAVQKTKYAKLGKEEFRRCVGYVSNLSHVQDQNENDDLQIGVEFADIIFWKLKSTIISIIWGEFFPDVFSLFLKTIDKANNKLVSSRLDSSASVKSCERVQSEFDLMEKYDVILSDDTSFMVAFEEDNFIQEMYTNEAVYGSIGKEFCVIFDVFYGKTGTEAVVESFYRVVEAQEQDGGQHLETLGDRAKVDWRLPAVVSCQRAVKEMATMHIDGDKEHNRKKHRIPVFRDPRSIRKNDGMSKVITRIATTEPPLPFLV